MIATDRIDFDLVKAEQKKRFKRTEQILHDRAIPLPFPAPKDLPWGVKTEQSPTNSAGGAWRTLDACKKRSGMTIVASVAVEDDGELWYHVSLARVGKMPSYVDMAWVKEHWIGRDRWAIQCFVPESEHVNVHSNCLHLWYCLTCDRPFPEFAVGGSI